MSSILGLLLIILVSFNSLNSDNTFKKRESARKLPVTRAGYLVSIKASVKLGDLPPRDSTGEGKMTRENQGSFRQPWQKKMSCRKEFVFTGCAKPIAAHPRISLFSIWVLAARRSQLLAMLPTSAGPWDWLMSLCSAAHPHSKEKAHLKKLNFSAT